ncbi:MAG: S-methyl-5-thioribose-1-phosphate isomerase [Elusimicrobiota bacterium]|nr:S-methyl-5-thioribose-1-phosphate isomerase [Elusimicrobiota bacterium]
MINTIRWKKGKVYILDQKKLPHKEEVIECRNYRKVALCIEKMSIRGAPAIGIASAMGMALGARSIKDRTKDGFFKKLEIIANRFLHTRPTGANLFWAIERLVGLARKNRRKSLQEIKYILEKEAINILKEDIRLNKQIGKNGLKLINRPVNILTHCNTGSLATGGYGTALGVIREAHSKGRIKKVFVDETRPALQGARLTTWELVHDKIPAVLVCDNMAGYLMQKGFVDCVIVGADRIAANGDVVNKIGTYTLAVLAKHHRVPFYVAAPSSTVDMKTHQGGDVAIEQRDAREVLEVQGKIIAPRNMAVVNPAFDLTPHKLVSAIITEKGIIRQPDRKKMVSLFTSGD